MIARLQGLPRLLLRAVLLWGVAVLTALLMLAIVLLLGAVIAQPSGAIFNPAYLLGWLPALALLPGYVLYAVASQFVPHMPAFLRRGWLPALLGVLGVAAVVVLAFNASGSSPFYIRSTTDMAPQALCALQGLVISLVALGEALAGLWAQKTAQPATAGSPELVK